MMIALSEHDKEIISLIDTQVKVLIERKTSDHVIISTLIEFIPEVRCFTTATCENDMNLYSKNYQYFNYFLQLINHSFENNNL